MRLNLVALLSVVISMMVFSTAWAAPSKYGPLIDDKPNPYDGWALQKIIADPDFHPLTNPRITTPSRTCEGADPGAPLVYEWIGYIDLPRDYYGTQASVFFDRTGASVTMVVDPYGNPYEDLVPIWCVGVIDYLCLAGILEGPY